MLRIIEEIKKQPHHIRHLFMWLFVFTASCAVGLIWYVSTKAELVGLVNPVRVREAQRAVAKGQSGLAAVGSGWSQFAGNVRAVFGGTAAEGQTSFEPAATVKAVPIIPQTLPIVKPEGY